MLDVPTAAPLTSIRPLPSGWAADARATAARRGKRFEDPASVETLPLPSPAALVLVRGSARIVLCPAPAGRVRPVLVFASEHAPTAPEGVEVPGARVFVRDGVAIVWSLTALGTVDDAVERARYLAATVVAP
jgi:hypothetical protein